MSDHKAIKTQYHGSSYDGKISINTNFGGDDITLRFSGVPTEMQYKVPETMQIDLYDDLRAEFDDKLKQIHEKHGMEVYKKASSDIVSAIRYKIYGSPELKKLDAELKSEVVEIIEHFETLMKAHLVDYAANRYKVLNAAIDRMSKQAHETLNNVLAHGAEAIPNVKFDDDEEST